MPICNFAVCLFCPLLSFFLALSSKNRQFWQNPFLIGDCSILQKWEVYIFHVLYIFLWEDTCKHHVTDLFRGVILPLPDKHVESANKGHLVNSMLLKINKSYLFRKKLSLIIYNKKINHKDVIKSCLFGCIGLNCSFLLLKKLCEYH